MAAIPLLEELSGMAPGRSIHDLAGYPDSVPPALVEQVASRPRRLAVYPASAGFDLVEELDHLAARAMEPNLFFNPRFLAPAMPRLQDREVRLAVIRDGDEHRSRLRLLLPFTVERPAAPFGVAHLRVWSHPFGPLGTPLVDRDDPASVIVDFLDMLARPHLRLPKVFVMQDVRLDGPFAATMRTLAESRDLPLEITGRSERPFLSSTLAGDDYLLASLGADRLREFERMKERLAGKGQLDHAVARRPDEVRLGTETFLALDAAGRKGRARTAMASDRYHAAFVREATHRLAEKDLCRVHTLTLGGRPVACLVVFVEHGVGYAWRMACDEEHAAFSPGTLLMIEATRTHLDDPNIDITDSCAIAGDAPMAALWSERRPLGSLVIGLTPDAGRKTRHVATHLYRQTRSVSRSLRVKVRRAFRRG